MSLAEAIAEGASLAHDIRSAKRGRLAPIIERWYEDNPDNPGSEIRVSALWQLCAFKGFLDAVFPDAQVRPRTIKERLTMGFGTGFHWWFQNEVLGPAGILKGHWHCPYCKMDYTNAFWPKMSPAPERGFLRCKEGPNNEHRWTYKETEVSTSYGVVGHIDGIIVLDRREGVLDIKTCNNRKFQYYLQEPPKSYEFQLQIYLNIIGMDFGILLYVNRDTGDFKEHLIHRDPKFLENAEEKIRQHVDWKNNLGAKDIQAVLADLRKTLEPLSNLPARACVGPEDERARWCNQAESCWNTKLLEGLVGSGTRKSTAE